MKQILLISILSHFLSFSAYGKPERFYVIKAAFIYKFTQYVTWSALERSQFFAQIIGEEKLYEATLKVFKDKKVAKLPVVFEKNNSSKKLGQVELIVFSSCKDIPTDFNIKKVVSTLVVTEGDCLNRSHVNLKLEDDKFVFNINLGLIKNSQLKISSRLLKLAKVVIR